MIFKKALLLIPLIYYVYAHDHLRYKHIPIRILDLKNVAIEDYHGPMNAKNLLLFENVETMTLRGCNFTSFNEDFVHPLKKLKKFVLANCHFDRVKNDVSKCCKHLEEVELFSTSMGPISAEEFKKWSAIKTLKRLYFFEMDVPALTANVWEGSNLKKLEIEFSKLETVEDGSLDGMNKLEVLNLRGNKLKTIPTKTLAALKDLKHLDLRKNLLEKVTTEDFPVMPNLEKVNLGHNPVKEINLKGLMEKLPKLKEVDVSGIDIDPAKNEGIPILKVAID